jgi:hypothetical protein
MVTTQYYIDKSNSNSYSNSNSNGNSNGNSNSNKNKNSKSKNSTAISDATQILLTSSSSCTTKMVTAQYYIDNSKCAVETARTWQGEITTTANARNKDGNNTVLHRQEQQLQLQLQLQLQQQHQQQQRKQQQ